MIQTIKRSMFIDAFKLERPDNFSDEGLSALFDWLTEHEKNTGDTIDLDVIAICGEFGEYTLEELSRIPTFIEDTPFESVEEAASALDHHGAKNFRVNDNTLLVHAGFFMWPFSLTDFLQNNDARINAKRNKSTGDSSMNTQQWSDVARYKNEIENGETIAFIWCIDDVYQQAETDGIDDLTHEEAKSVLYRLRRNHDATIGINWDTISYWIEEIRREP